MLRRQRLLWLLLRMRIMILDCLLLLLLLHNQQLQQQRDDVTMTRIEVQTNQHHPSLPQPSLDQRRSLHHLVLLGEILITKITATVVEEEGEERTVGTGIIVVKKTDDMIMIIVTIDEVEGVEEEVMIDMMIEIGI